MNRSIQKKEIVLEIITFFYVCLFLYAAGSKAMEFDAFQAQLLASPLLTKFALWIAWCIPSVEILIAIIILIPRSRYVGFLLGYGLMLAFTVYIAWILTSSRDLPCSCGGILSMLGWKEHLFLNLAFVGLGLFGIFLSKDQYHKAINFRQNLRFILGLSVLGPAVIFGLYIVSAPQLTHRQGFKRVIKKDFIQENRYMELENDTYYLAGSFKNRLYFGAGSNPNTLLSTDNTSSVKSRINVRTDKDTFSTSNSSIQIDSAFFYIKDRDNHKIYKGKTGEWTAHQILGNTPYFTQAV